MTTMQMNEGLDTGDMILKTEIPLVKRRLVEACTINWQRQEQSFV